MGLALQQINHMLTHQFHQHSYNVMDISNRINTILVALIHVKVDIRYITTTAVSIMRQDKHLHHTTLTH